MLTIQLFKMVNRDKEFIKKYLEEKGIKGKVAQKTHPFTYNEVLQLMRYAHESERLDELICGNCNKKLLFPEENRHKIIICPNCKFENKIVGRLF